MKSLQKIALRFNKILNKTAGAHKDLELLLESALSGDQAAYQVFLDGVEELYPEILSALKTKDIYVILRTLSDKFPKIIKGDFGFTFNRPIGWIENISFGFRFIDIITVNKLNIELNINNLDRGLVSFTNLDNLPKIEDVAIVNIKHITNRFLVFDYETNVSSLTNNKEIVNLYYAVVNPVVEDYKRLCSILIQ